jgi:hypothetical protein
VDNGLRDVAVTVVNLADVADNIAHVEQLTDPTSWVLGDAHAWLILRDVFLQPFNVRVNRLYRRYLRGVSHSDPMSWGQIDITRLDLDRPPKVSTRRVGATVLANLAGLVYPPEGGGALVYGRFTDYHEVIAGKVLSRIDDGIALSAPTGLPVHKLMGWMSSAPLLPYARPPHLLHEPDADRANPPAVSGEDELLRRFDSLLQEARGAGIEFVYEPLAMRRRLRTLVWRAQLLEPVLELFAPRVVLSASTVTMERQSVMLAAARQGITSVDVEHGFHAPLGPYGNLHFVPAEGARTVADWFWTWGKEQAEFLRGTALPERTAHRAVVGGNPWSVAQQRLGQNAANSGASPANEDVAQLRPPGKRTALFCWQPDMIAHESEPRLLPAALVDAARSVQDRCRLLVRLHPRSRHLIPVFARLLRAAGLSDAEVLVSSTASLRAVLDVADVLITSYSTVAFEGNDVGVPVLICDRLGARMMAHYLRPRGFAVGLEADEIAAALVDGLPQQEVFDYIPQNSAPAAEAAWATVLEQSP